MYKFSIQVILDIGYEKYRQKFNINFLAQKFGEKYRSMLAGIYVFTGGDVIECFQGKRKIEYSIKTLNRPHTIMKLSKFLNVQNIALYKTWRWVESFEPIM